MRQLESTYIKAGQPDTGKVRIVWKNMAFIGAESVTAAEAAECANDQGKFWEYADTLFANQNPTGAENIGTFKLANVKVFAQGIPGLDLNTFNTCLDSGKHTSAIQQETTEGKNLGVVQTPTIFVNGQKTDVGIDAINQAVAKALGQ